MMRPLGAIDAIGPSYNRTLALLDRPRNWRFLWKFCLVAFFTQVGQSGGNLRSLPTNSSPFGALSPFWIHLIYAAVLFFSVLGLVLFYVGSRMEFVLFELVLRPNTSVREVWDRYGAVTWRLIGLKLLFLVVVLLVSLPVLVPLLIHLAHHDVSSSHVGDFLSQLLVVVGVLLLVVLILSAVARLLFDFGLPSIALENTSIPETAGRVWRLVRAEPGEAVLYVVMKFLLMLAGALVANLILGVIALVATIPLGGLAYVLWATMHMGDSGVKAAMITGFVVLGAILLVIMFVTGVFAFGLISIFSQTYALYFLAGRYPLLASYLEPASVQGMHAPVQPNHGPAPPGNPALA